MGTFFQNVKLCAYILGADITQQQYNDIMVKYEDLAEVIVSGAADTKIVSNIQGYAVLLNYQLFISLMNISKGIDFITNYKNLNRLKMKALEGLDSSKNSDLFSAYQRVHKTMIAKLKSYGVSEIQSIEINDILTTLKAWGLEEITVEPEELEYEEIEIDLSDIEFSEDNDSLEDSLDWSENEIGYAEEDKNTEYYLEEALEELEDELIDSDDLEEALENELEELEDELIDSDDLEEALEELTDEEIIESKSLNSGDISGKADDLINNQSKNEEAVEQQVEQILDNILSMYSIIYQPLFSNPPVGVLYTKGELDNGYNRKAIMCVGKSKEKDGVKVHDIPSLALYMHTIYSTIENKYGLKEAPPVGEHGMSVKASWINPDGTMKYNYAPHIQVRNCVGVYRDKETNRLKRASNWREFKTKIKEDLKPTIKDMLNRVDVYNPDILKRATESIQEFYTTIVLVNEFNQKQAMRFTICNTSASLTGKTNGIAEAIIEANPLSKSSDSYKIMSDSESNYIRNVLIVTDIDMYRGEINFAYKTLGKLLQSGGQIKLSNTVVGTSVSGEPVTVNLNDNSYTSIGIIAGTRSGKGVLTLSLLASMLGCGCPVVYLDYKPDMCGVFWNLDRKYKNVTTLAVDGSGSKFADGLVPARILIPNSKSKSGYSALKRGYGGNTKVKSELAGHLNLIPYVKGLQLMNVVASARISGKLPSDKKMFFVVDEAQKAGNEIGEVIIKLKKIVEKYRPKSKDKDKTESEEYKYAVKLYDVFSTLEDSIGMFMNTTAGSGKMSALILGQEPDSKLWDPCVKSLILKSPLKFLGTGTTKSQYTAGLKPDIENVSLIGTGYFGVVKGVTSSRDNTQVVKTTMILNEADFDKDVNKRGKFSRDLLNNLEHNPELQQSVIDNDFIVSSNNEVAIAEGFEVGSINPLVGFPGMVEFIGKNIENFDIEETLSLGYNMVYKVLNLLGIVGPDKDVFKYTTVESYLYSAKEDSLFSDRKLIAALNEGKTIYEYLSSSDEQESNYEETSMIKEEDYEIPLGGVESQINEQDENKQQTQLNDEIQLGEIEEAFSDVNNSKVTKSSDIKFTNTYKLMKLGYSEQDFIIYVNRILMPRLTRKQYDLKDRTINATSSLGHLVIAVSNLHYICTLGVYGLNQFKDKIIIPRIKSGDTIGMVMMGLLNSYDMHNIQYDKIPSEDQLKRYIDEYTIMQTNLNAEDSLLYNVTDIDIDMANLIDESELCESRSSSIINNSYEEDMRKAEPMFSVDNDGIVKIKPRNTNNIVISSPDNYINLNPKEYGFVKKFRKKLFESRNGTAYEFKKRWEFILKEIKLKVDNTSAVTVVKIKDTNIIVNGKIIMLGIALDSDYDIELQDIANIHELLKTFKLVQLLELDSPMTQVMMREYGEDAQGIWQMFKENKNLRELHLIPYGSSNPVVHKRESFSKTAETLNKQLKKEKQRIEYEQFAAAKNPRLKDKSPGYIKRTTDFAGKVGNAVWKGTSTGGNIMMKNAKESLQNKSFGGATLWSITAFGLIVTGGLLSIPGKIVGFAGDKLNKLKK